MKQLSFMLIATLVLLAVAAVGGAFFVVFDLAQSPEREVHGAVPGTPIRQVPSPDRVPRQIEARLQRHRIWTSE